MAFNDIVVGIVVEYSVNRSKYLRLGDPAIGVHHKVLQDATFTARQDQRLTTDLRIPTIGENPNRAGRIRYIGR